MVELPLVRRFDIDNRILQQKISTAFRLPSDFNQYTTFNYSSVLIVSKFIPAMLSRSTKLTALLSLPVQLRYEGCAIKIISASLINHIINLAIHWLEWRRPSFVPDARLL